MITQWYRGDTIPLKKVNFDDFILNYKSNATLSKMTNVILSIEAYIIFIDAKIESSLG